MIAKPTVLVTRRWPEEVEAELSKHFDVTFNKNDIPLRQGELLEAFLSHDAIFSTVTDRINKDVFPKTNNRVQLIGNFGVGFNNIDIEMAKSHGIAVTNTPDVLTDATAEIAMALILGVARRVGEGETHLRRGAWTGWRPTHMLGRQVTGKTLGVIGYGRIGQATAHRAHHGFGMKIIVFSRSPVQADILAKNGARQVKALEELMSDSDFVTLHCPATAENHHLINRKTLSMMKREAFLINTARGDLVNEHDLVEALNSGVVAGAGLDVFETEPEIPRILQERSDVLLLPHLGSATVETRNAMGFKVIENALAYFGGSIVPNRVV